MTKLVLLLIPALAGAVIYAGQVSRQRDDARAQAAAAKSQMVQMTAQRDACIASVRKQNALIETLRVAAEKSAAAMRARAKDAHMKAGASLRDAEKRAGELNVATIGPRCEDAIGWGNAQAKELGAWVESLDAR